MCLCVLFVCFACPVALNTAQLKEVAILGHRNYLHQIDSPMRFRRGDVDARGGGVVETLSSKAHAFCLV